MSTQSIEVPPALREAAHTVLEAQDKAVKWQLDQARFASTQAELSLRQGMKAVETATKIVRDTQQAALDAWAPKAG